MKINRLDAHDRLLQFKQQEDLISQGCESCIYNRPEEFGQYPFYIFAHKREIGMDERISLFSQDQMDVILNPLLKRKYSSFDQIPTARIIWQSRLLKPQAQLNSMLFKHYPGRPGYEVFWILPAAELWDSYRKGNLTENKVVIESIHNFQFNKSRMEASESDDVSEEKAKEIYEQIARNAKGKKREFII
jgi:hypothetical protein